MRDGARTAWVPGWREVPFGSPHYRLEQRLVRLGVPAARSTINDLLRRAGRELEPLRAPLFQALKADFVVRANETSFTMTKQTSKALIWAFVGALLCPHARRLRRTRRAWLTDRRRPLR